MRKVLWFLSDRRGCGVYRVAAPVMYLQGTGRYDSELMEQEQVVRHGSLRPQEFQDFDTHVYQRAVGPVWLEAMQEAKRQGVSVVMEFDDDLFNVPRTNPASEYWERKDVQRCLRTQIRLADRILVSTKPLAHLIMAETGISRDRISVCSNHLSPDLWGEDILSGVTPFQNEGRVIGWQGSTTHETDFSVAAGALVRITEMYPDVQLRFFGSLPQVIKNSVPAARRQITKGVEFMQYPGTLKFLAFDIGIAPLTPCRFNDSKCLDPHTLITTEGKGVVPVKAVEVGDRVWRNGWKRVVATSVESASPGVEIVTTRGLRLRVTTRHQIKTVDGWTRAQDLRVGSRVQLGDEQCGTLPYRQVPWPADGRRTREGDVGALDFVTVTSGPRVTLNETWGRILGLFTGDGCFGSKTAVTFSCDGQDADLIDRLITDLTKCGLKATTESVRTYAGQLLRRRSVRVACAHFTRFLAGLGLGQPHARLKNRFERTLRVPAAIFESPLSVRLAFLCGLFEADGTCSRASASVSVTTKSQRLAEDVQRLLWSVGVTSAIQKARGSGVYYDRNYWAVRLRSAEVRQFVATGSSLFLSLRKCGLLQTRLARKSSNAAKPVQWVDPIVAITPCRIEDPVDLQVEGEEFMAAGVVSHNSNLKWLEYAALKVPCVASAVYPYAKSIDHGRTGFLAKTETEWVESLRALLDSQELRQKVGQAAYDEVWLQHSAEVRGPAWDSAFSHLPVREGVEG